MQWVCRKERRKALKKDGKLFKKTSKKSATKRTTMADPRSQHDHMYTTIIGSELEQHLAWHVRLALERVGDIIVESKETVVPNESKKEANSDEFIKYIKQNHVTGVLVLSSDELDKFLEGNENIVLQITEQNVRLDSKSIAEAFKTDSNVRKKLLLVVRQNGKKSKLGCLQNVDFLELDDDEGDWADQIKTKFEQKVISNK